MRSLAISCAPPAAIGALLAHYGVHWTEPVFWVAIGGFVAGKSIGYVEGFLNAR